MGMKGTLSGLLAWPPQLVASDPSQHENVVHLRHELRQRHLMRLRTNGIPLWSEQPEHCDACDRALLAGEQPVLVRRGDELLLACALCAERLYDEGYLRVDVEIAKDTVEETGLPIAS
jgi:hypothetical protein